MSAEPDEDARELANTANDWVGLTRLELGDPAWDVVLGLCGVGVSAVAFADPEETTVVLALSVGTLIVEAGFEVAPKSAEASAFGDAASWPGMAVWLGELEATIDC